MCQPIKMQCWDIVIKTFIIATVICSIVYSVCPKAKVIRTGKTFAATYINPIIVSPLGELSAALILC